MVQIPDSLFFPPLDKCFSGEIRLISWRAAHEVICNPEFAADTLILEKFLSENRCLALLAHPFEVFPGSPSESSRDFETRTAAINVTPSEGGPYSIAEIKEDAIWLARHSDLDKVSALRLVILEWQARPALELLSGYSESESLSIQQTIGNGNTLTSVLSSRYTNVTGSNNDKHVFTSAKNRRNRLLRYYLTEQEHRIACTLAILASTPRDSKTLLEKGSRDSPNMRKKHDSMLKEIRRKVFEAQNSGNNSQASRNSSLRSTDFLHRCIDAIRGRFDTLEVGCPVDWKETIVDNDKFEEFFQKCQFTEIIHIFHLMFIRLNDTDVITTSSTIRAWFDLCDNFGFFQNLQPPSSRQQLFIAPLQSFVSMISLMMLKLPLTAAYLSDESGKEPNFDLSQPDINPYIVDPACQNRISDVLFTAAGNAAPVASLTVFAWSIILQTMRGAVTAEDGDLVPIDSRISDTDNQQGDPGTITPLSAKSKCMREVLDSVTSMPLDEDPIAYLAHSATSILQVYTVIMELSSVFGRLCGRSTRTRTTDMACFQLLQLLRESLPHTGYGPEVVAATLAVLGGSIQSSTYPSKIDMNGSNVSRFFLEDREILYPMLLQQAQFRYPYEIAPLLKLCKVLTFPKATDAEGNLITRVILEAMPRFTQTLPDHFDGYELVREDENANSVKLKEALILFLTRNDKLVRANTPGRQPSSLVVFDSDDSSVIPQGTLGYVINDSKPFIVMWEHDHSALKYLARLISTALVASTQMDATGPIDRETIADIVELFATLIASLSKMTPPQIKSKASLSDALVLLDAASDGLDRNQDIITVVASIFETDVHRQQTTARSDASTEVLSVCLEFFAVVLPILPGRIWPLLANSELLDIDAGGGQLADIVSAIEMVSGQYIFLQGCLRLFNALVEEIVTHAAARRAPSVTSTRFNNASELSAGITQKSMSKIMLAFTRTFAEVLQNSSQWHFTLEEDRTELNTGIIKTFDRVADLVYTYDDINSPHHKITAVLSSSGAYIVETFGSNPGHLTPNRLLQLLSLGSLQPFSTVHSRHTNLGIAQASAAFTFLTTLINVSISLRTQFKDLEAQIISLVPLFSRMYATDQVWRQPIINLLNALVKAIGFSKHDPPAIFGHLDVESSKCFLSILTEFNKPLMELDLEIKIWKFMSAIVSNRQRWLATFLLTGNTPKDIGKTNGRDNQKQWQRPLLDLAIETICEIANLPPQRILAILDFVAAAQNHWPWVTSKLEKNPRALSSMASFLDQLRDDHNTKDPTHAISVAKRNRIACLINEILAAYLYSSRQIGDDGFVKTLIPKLGYLRARAVDVPSYNSSLHKNLESNFRKCFPGIELSSFKWTVPREEFGANYFYDLTFAANVLGYHSSWASSKDRGFAQEFFRANCNLSLVESQILLLRSWSTLAMELSSYSPLELDLQKHLCGVVQNCLVANEVSESSEQIFEDLRQSRIDLALVLLQRLTDSRSQVPRMLELLTTAWRVIRTSGQDFEIAFIGRNTTYYRSLLRILFLSLQPHAYIPPPNKLPTNKSDPISSAEIPPQKAPDATPILVEIVTEVVAKGFRSLATQLHEGSPDTVLPSDFALLTALLQTILAIPGIQNIQSQIALRLYSSDVSRNATALFSWSDRLTAPNNDPIFGELSILFLLTLSSIPLVAENLAVEGILSQLASATLTRYYNRPQGAGPFDNPTRVHAIWTRGILPICLNLLSTTGAPMATEVASFLADFGPQLTRASASLDAKTGPSPAHPTAGCITLGLAAEMQSLALLAAMLERFRGQPGTGDIPELIGWDRAAVKEDLEGWVQGSRAALRARVVPSNEREVEISRMKAKNPDSGCENQLEERVLLELRGALICLGGDAGATEGA